MEANGYHHHNSWIPHSQTQKMACFGNEFRFIEDDTVHHENDMNGIPFLSWRLNVTDRPSLVHDFTRWSTHEDVEDYLFKLLLSLFFFSQVFFSLFLFYFLVSCFYEVTYKLSYYDVSVIMDDHDDYDYEFLNFNS